MNGLLLTFIGPAHILRPFLASCKGNVKALKHYQFQKNEWLFSTYGALVSRANNWEDVKLDDLSSKCLSETSIDSCSEERGFESNATTTHRMKVKSECILSFCLPMYHCERWDHEKLICLNTFKITHYLWIILVIIAEFCRVFWKCPNLVCKASEFQAWYGSMQVA